MIYRTLLPQIYLVIRYRHFTFTGNGLHEIDAYIILLLSPVASSTTSSCIFSNYHKKANVKFQPDWFKIFKEKMKKVKESPK